MKVFLCLPLLCSLCSIMASTTLLKIDSSREKSACNGPTFISFLNQALNESDPSWETLPDTDKKIEWETLLKSKHPIFIGALKDDQLVGLTGYFQKKDTYRKNTYQGICLYVHPAYRKQGIARSLVQTLCKDIPSPVREDIYFTINLPREKLGFLETIQQYLPFLGACITFTPSKLIYETNFFAYPSKPSVVSKKKEG